MTERLAVTTGTFAHANAIKTRSTFQLIIEIPIESADRALEALGGWPQPGKERSVAVALLNPNRTLAGGPNALNLERKHTSLAQLAGILCGDNRFQHFLSEKYGHVNVPCPHDTPPALWAGDKLRAICGVNSRKEFDTDSHAAKRFIDVKEAFEAWQQ